MLNVDNTIFDVQFRFMVWSANRVVNDTNNERYLAGFFSNHFCRR